MISDGYVEACLIMHCSDSIISKISLLYFVSVLVLVVLNDVV